MKLATLLLLLGSISGDARAAESLARWVPFPADWKGAAITDGSATLTGDKWASLRAPQEFATAQISACITIAEAAKSVKPSSK